MHDCNGFCTPSTVHFLRKSPNRLLKLDRGSFQMRSGALHDLGDSARVPSGSLLYGSTFAPRLHSGRGLASWSPCTLLESAPSYTTRMCSYAPSVLKVRTSDDVRSRFVAAGAVQTPGSFSMYEVSKRTAVRQALEGEEARATVDVAAPARAAAPSFFQMECPQLPFEMDEYRA